MGMKDIQREGWEYELTVSLNIDRDTHTAQASKDRTELFEGKDPFVITEATGNIIRKWCEQGIEPPAPAKKPLTAGQFTTYLNRIQAKEEGLLAKVKDTFSLTAEQLAELKPFEAVAIVEPV